MPRRESNKNLPQVTSVRRNGRAGFTTFARGHFKLEMQSWNLVTRMILCIGKLRLPVKQLWFGGRSLIDTRKQVDQMLAGSARCGEVNNDVALTVEAAYVSHVRVIVRGDIDVVVVGPADAFKVDRDGCSNRSRSRGHADDTGLDHKASERDRLFAVAQRESVQSAEIFGNDNREFDPAIASNLYFGDDAFSW